MWFFFCLGGSYFFSQMGKETFYFSHDYEPTSDPKIQALLGEFGAVGYGVYWRIVEMLHSSCDHKLPFKQYLFLAIAKQMLTSAEQIEAIIRHAIEIYELFNSDAEYFWSNRVNRNFEVRAELSEKRAVAGRLGAIAKQNLANTSKGKERKEKKKESIIKKFIHPSLDEVLLYFTENGYSQESAKRAFEHYELGNWFDTNGKPVIAWKQKMHTVWFKPENKIREIVLPKKKELVPGYDLIPNPDFVDPGSEIRRIR